MKSFSLGGWLCLVMAISEKLGRWVGGLLMLAPAVGCLLPYYVEKVVTLRAMQMTNEVERVEKGEVIRLGEGFPLSNSFQSSSWDFGIGCPKLNLDKATFPVSIIIGDDDQRITTAQITELTTAQITE